MPEAAPTDTRTLSCVVASLSLIVRPGDFAGDTVLSLPPYLGERELLLACQAARTRCEATGLLLAAVADLHPDDPRHQASHAVVAGLRPNWATHLDRVSALPARGMRGVAAKAALVSHLAERDEAGHVAEAPLLRVATSLADDLLRLDAG